MNKALVATIASVALAVTVECGGGSGNNCDHTDDRNAGTVYAQHPPSNKLSEEYTLDVRRSDSTNVTVSTDKFGYDHCPKGAHWPSCHCG